MSLSTKYGRTYHYDFSPGTTSDDRINRLWRDDIQKFKTIIHGEKLDGENNCLSQYGVFARSHAAPSRNPWSEHLKIIQSQMANDLKENNMDIFGENMYAQHSIVYPKLDRHFYVFGIRVLDKWLSWEEVEWYSNFFDLPTVPILDTQDTSNVKLIEDTVIKFSSQESVFGSVDVDDNSVIVTREGIVSRNIDEYSVDDFANNVYKYVRKNHIKTADTQHWTRNWKRARLVHEY